MVFTKTVTLAHDAARYLRRVLCLLAAMAFFLPATSGTVMSASLKPVAFGDLQGWDEEDHLAALSTFARSCERMVKAKRSGKALGRSISAAKLTAVCRRALSVAAAADGAQARAYFEENFTPLRVIDGADRGLFTGYFEPQYAGSRTRTLRYHVPLYRKPPDFRQPYLDREQIERGALDGKGLELVFLESLVDAFFIHVQGSARISLPDGSVMRVGFAAKSGHPYTAIGRVLIDRGALRREEVTMQTIRAWLEKNPSLAQEVMWQNQSFIFFREARSVAPHLGPLGAQGVNLTGLRSIAIDRSLYSYGLPMWLETTLPVDDIGTEKPLSRIMIAQDTGSAIKGAIRADVYVGSGEEAGEIAGRMKQKGALFVLMPH